MPAQVSTIGTRQFTLCTPPLRCTTADSGASHSSRTAIRVAATASAYRGHARSPSDSARTWAGSARPISEKTTLSSRNTTVP